MDNQRDFNEFRAQVSAACNGHWEEWFSLYVNADDISTLFNRRNIPCPECGRNGKFFLASITEGSGHCCHASCNYHTYDGLATICALSNNKLGDVTTNIAAHLGLLDKKPKQAFVPKKPKVVKRTKMTEQEIKTLKNVLNSSVKMEEGDFVWQYLINRGLPTGLLSALCEEGLILSNESLYFKPDGNRYLGMVVPVKSPAGKIVGAHRTFLTRDDCGGVSKIDHEHNKMLTGSFEDAYIGSRIELGGPACNAIGICEGIETALAINAMGVHCWPLLNTAGLQSFVPPEGVSTVYVFADNDISKAGQTAAAKCKDRLTSEGYRVKCYLPKPPQGSHIQGKSYDWLDHYLSAQQYRKTC